MTYGNPGKHGLVFQLLWGRLNNFFLQSFLELPMILLGWGLGLRWTWRKVLSLSLDHAVWSRRLAPQSKRYVKKKKGSLENQTFKEIKHVWYLKFCNAWKKEQLGRVRSWTSLSFRHEAFTAQNHIDASPYLQHDLVPTIASWTESNLSATEVTPQIMRVDWVDLLLCWFFLPPPCVFFTSSVVIKYI